MTIDEPRPLFDEHGLLREDADFVAPAFTEAYAIFAQRDDGRIELPLWQRHAAQFFSVRLGLTIPKVYEGPRRRPKVDAAQIILVEEAHLSHTLVAYTRPATRADLMAAEDAETTTGYTGLSDLARRCHQVWQVIFEKKTERAPLLLSAILASVLLGPILSPNPRELFGVRTARQKLEGLQT